MKNFLRLWLDQLAGLLRRIFNPEKPQPPARCQFCGGTDHEVADCPNAAKYKLFHVDRD